MHWIKDRMSDFIEKEENSETISVGEYGLIVNLFPSTEKVSLVVDNAKSHSDLYKSMYRRKRLALLSKDLEMLVDSTSGRFVAICECFEEIHPKPPKSKARFDRWGTDEKCFRGKELTGLSAGGLHHPFNVSLLCEASSLPETTSGNVSMPQRQESADPHMIATLWENACKKGLFRSELNILDDEDGEGFDNVPPPPSLVNANMPQRQESEDPEVVQALLASLKDY